MNEIIEFLTSQEIIVVYIVVGVALLLCLIIYLIDKNYDKRKRRQNTKKLNKLVEDVNNKILEDEEKNKNNSSKISENEPMIIEPNVEVAQNFSNRVDYNSDVDKQMSSTIDSVHDKIEKIIYTNSEPDKEEATRELLKITEQLEKEELARKELIDVDSYESAQEENAIISLDELNKRSEAMYKENEVTQYADEGDEPISLEDLEKRKAKVINSEINNKIDEDENAYHGQRVKSNDIFSSVFGTINKNSIQSEEELEKTNQFLISLKELQSKLN